MNRTLDAASLQLLRLFSSVTGVVPKDCMAHEGVLTFVVSEGDLGKSVGHGGMHVRRLEQSLKRKIKIVEWSPILEKFVENLVAPLRLERVYVLDGVVHVAPRDRRTRGLLIGPRASSLRMMESIVQRFFECKEIRIDG